jgi:phage shock protein A
MLNTMMSTHRMSTMTRARPTAHHARVVLKTVSVANYRNRPTVRPVAFTPVSRAGGSNNLLSHRKPSHPQRPGMARRISRVPVTAVQANLISRMVRVFQAYVGQVVSSFEAPERVLDRVVEEMQEDLVKMRQATAQVLASERQMNAKYKQAQTTADEWLRRAELAVSKGQDDMAREALKRRKAFQENADKLKIQLDAQNRATEQLTANARTLEAKLSEARNKKETLKARAAAAKSSKEIQDMIGGLRLNSSTAWAAFDKMEEKVMELEAGAEQAALLSSPDSLEQKFAQLEVGTVDDELSALKKGMLTGQGRPVGRITEGKPMRDFFGDPAVDRELEELRIKARR